MSTVNVNFMTDWNEERITYLVKGDEKGFDKTISVSITGDEYDEYTSLTDAEDDASRELHFFMSGLRKRYNKL